jgi:hypothetical protein
VNATTWQTLALAALTFLYGVTADQCSPSHAQAYTEHEVAIAQLAVNEGSFREADIAAIAYARAPYSVEQLRTMHRRALAVGRTDSRRWIEHLDATLARPDGWPEHLVPWETRGRDGWERTLRTVHDVVSGRVVPCDVRPSTWGGRTLDATRIARMTANGWQLARCGATANAFLRRGEP